MPRESNKSTIRRHLPWSPRNAGAASFPDIGSCGVSLDRRPRYVGPALFATDSKGRRLPTMDNVMPGEQISGHRRNEPRFLLSTRTRNLGFSAK